MALCCVRPRHLWQAPEPVLQAFTCNDQGFPDLKGGHKAISQPVDGSAGSSLMCHGAMRHDGGARETSPCTTESARGRSSARERCGRAARSTGFRAALRPFCTTAEGLLASYGL